jgi:serpin B
MDVSEKGTEAAAVTSAQVRMTSVRPAVSMTVDRPFIFVIADIEDKDILFAGKIVNI